MASTYGASLPDSEPLVHARLTAYVNVLPSFATFLQAHASESQSYSQKLSGLIGSYRKQTAREAYERGGEASTFEAALAGVLEQMDIQAREHGIRADKEVHEVANKLAQVGARLDAVRKKHHDFYKRLLSERDRTNEQRDKSRAAYYSACEAVESARQKKAAAKEGRDTEKATRAYDAATEEMLVAKNQYLLDIDSSNVAKERLYNVHLPALHDDYQQLEQSTTLQFVHLIEREVELQRESLERLGESVRKAKDEIAKVRPEQDQEAFVGRYSTTKLAAWEVPPDAVFEECGVWHDTDEFSTIPSATTYLQNVKIKSSARLSEIVPQSETKRRAVADLRNQRDSFEGNWGLGDAVGVIENLYATSHEASLLELGQTEHQSQIELIDATLGDSASSGLRPHEFKMSSFVTPSTCSVCDSSVWGKGLKCTKCSMAVHAKCELKVPAGCSARPGAGVVRHKSRKSVGSTTGGGAGGGGGSGLEGAHASMSSLSLAPTNSTSSSVGSSYSTPSSAGPPRRSVPPPFGSTPASAAPPSTAQSLPQAVLLYDYQATTGFELSVSVNDRVTIIEPEDESGWTKVRTQDGREGLVPGSYLEASHSSTVAPPPHVPTRQAVEAMYDYSAGAPDELSIREGERAYLTGKGMEYGEGWAEVEKDGAQGILPASYIQLV
ncbi:hypothetical protein JCM10212_004514 [Sporobolomyces blumeae]